MLVTSKEHLKAWLHGYRNSFESFALMLCPTKV
jgi:hypothetical protein